MEPVAERAQEQRPPDGAGAVDRAKERRVRRKLAKEDLPQRVAVQVAAEDGSAALHSCWVHEGWLSGARCRP